MQLKGKNNFYGGIVLSCLILLGVFTFTDLEISKSLSGMLPQFARLFEIYGYLPSCLLACGMSAIGFCTHKTVTRPIQKVLGYGLFPLVSVAGFSFGQIVLYREVWKTNPQPFLLLTISLLLTAVLFFIVSKIPSKQLAVYRKGALASLFCLILLLLGVEILKSVFGRVRFRDMTEPFSQFTQWYVMNGPSSHKSFPSGHTANAAAVLCLTLTAQKKQTRQILWVIGILYTIAMAFSRILAGAHFASDVLVGGLLGIGCVLLSRKLFHLPS